MFNSWTHNVSGAVLCSANTKHPPRVGSMLVHRLRRWANLEPIFDKCYEFAGMSGSDLSIILYDCEPHSMVPGIVLCGAHSVTEGLDRISLYCDAGCIQAVRTKNEMKPCYACLNKHKTFVKNIVQCRPNVVRMFYKCFVFVGVGLVNYIKIL